MTEQELQDKAKDLAKNVPLRKDILYPEMIRNFLASMYLRGYDDGKNDTTKWHYPSKGEYPPKGRQILAYAWNVHNVLAKYDTFDGKDIFVTFDAYNGFIEIKKVVRWQYIIPPQEEA